MYYNHPRLKINYNYLKKYDMLDSNMTIFYNSFTCVSFLRLESVNTEKLNFLPILLTQEWFYGQRLITQNYLSSSIYSRKSVRLKTSVRKTNFWNVLDLCLSSIFILEEPKNKFWGVFYHKKNTYRLILPFDLIRVDFLFPKTKERYFLFNFPENQPKSSINFLVSSKNSLQSYFIPHLNLKKVV
jgi:hypothetical protein